jgi:hypothetical protein
MRVRNVWRDTYRFHAAADFVDYTPAPLDQVAACNEGAPVADDTLQLDFGKGYEKSRWNFIILGRLLEKMMDMRTQAGGWGLPDVSDGYLMGLLQNRLKQCREAWARPQPRFSSAHGRFETEEEALDRASHNETVRFASSASQSRRQMVSMVSHFGADFLNFTQKFNRRVEIVKQVISLKTGPNAPDLATWKYFAKMLDLLDVDGMSSEEDNVCDLQGNIISVFAVKVCFWCANEISQYLELIDKEALNVLGPKSKPAPRVKSSVSGSTLRKGLPEQMYNPRWLAGLDNEYIERELCVSKEVFDFLVFATNS